MDEINVQIEEVPALEASINATAVTYETGGTTCHSQLTERSFPDQHPMAAITGLEEALENRISTGKLQEAVENALTIAKESGEFKGEKGDTGERGEKGEDGTGISILGSYSSESELRTAHPAGEIGDAYMIEGALYVWSATDNDWTNAGSIKGEKGDSGADGYTPVKGTDYYTEEDKAEMVNLVLAAITTWTGGNY